ncbi:hypothetical protein J6E39_01675 [bacterium]|nr:hypothetical protein [bacterium]
MGLAASQARFLAITARKANCEYKSMAYAQDKLEISRQLTNATADYQDALNSTKLVWNASGSETAVTDLSYNVMMSPSALNGYDPYLIVDPATGKVVLNDVYKKVMEDVEPKILSDGSQPGLQSDGTPYQYSKAGRDAFIDSLVKNGLLASSMGDLVKGMDYVKDAGLGAEPLDKTASNAMTLPNLIQYFNNREYGIDLNQILTTTDKDNKSTAPKYSSERKASEGWTLTENGTIQSGFKNAKDFNIATLLKKDVVLTANNMSREDFGAQVANIITLMAESLGYNSNEAKALYTDTKSQDALRAAYDATMLKFSNSSAVDAGGTKNTAGQYSNTLEKANDYNAITYSKGKDNTKCAVSLTNILSTFLTNYAQALEGYECGYSSKKEVKDSVSVTEDPSYYYIVNNTGSIASETDMLIADFYNIMYNNICSNGWTTIEGADINDQDYLRHALKNGQLFISSLNSDGYYYQGAYTDNGYIEEVTDNDAIAVAEAEYTKLKTQLDYKEERIDLQMKNLDLEISALSTEYDTVKSLISKGVEKTFTMFGS